MCGHKVKLPGLYYKKNNYSEHWVYFLLLNDMKSTSNWIISLITYVGTEKIVFNGWKWF